MARSAIAKKVEGRVITRGKVKVVLTNQGNLYTAVPGGFAHSTPQEVNLVKEVLSREREIRRLERESAAVAGSAGKKKKKQGRRIGRASGGIGSIIMEQKPLPALRTGHARKYPGGVNAVYGFKFPGGGFVGINAIGAKRKTIMRK